MRILMPVLFLILAAGGVFGLMAMNQSKNGGGEGGGGFALAMQLLTENATGSLVPEEPIGALASYLPLPPIGWTREGYVTAHGEALTEATYQPSNVVISGTNSLLSYFDSARRDANGAAVTYRKGEEVIAISIVARSDREMRSLQGSIMTAIGGSLSSQASFGRSSGPFATLHGVPFEEGGRSSRVMATGVEVPINYRSFLGRMGGQLSIRVLTNASDASLAEILGAIDVPGLNGTLMTPDLTVTAGTGYITRERGALSTLPPEPSLAYKAFQKLRSGIEGISQDDVRLLQSMASGGITGWTDIYDVHGLRHRMSDPIVAVLGPEPTLPPKLEVQYRAQAMLKSVGIHSRYEIDLLEGMARGRFDTQDEARRTLQKNRLYAPPVMALVNTLPVADVEQVAADGTEIAPTKELVIRRGINVDQGAPGSGNCSIELGVRYCTVNEGE